MAIEAPISKFKKNNLKIYIFICIALAAWCIYDAHFNESFKTKYADDWQLTANIQAPPYLIGFAVLMGVYYFVIRNKKLIAGDNELVFNDKKKIPYNSIQKIDKTYFDSKGYFIITYNNSAGKETNHKLSDKKYDNLKGILETIVAKIS